MEYSLEHTLIKIGVTGYIERYRDPDKFIKFCEECNRYNACWACPPYDFDSESYITPYTNAFIMGTKITPGKKLRSRCDSNKYFNKELFNKKQSKEITHLLITDVRKLLDGALLSLEQQYPNSRALFAGTCHLCPTGTCTRVSGSPCIYPEKIRPSLEAFGFDIGKTASELLGIELKWSHNGELPDYFMLVSGFFTNHNDIEIPLDAPIQMHL